MELYKFLSLHTAGQQSPVSSDAATTARASSIAGGVETLRRREMKPNNLTGHDPPSNNHLYDRFVLTPLRVWFSDIILKCCLTTVIFFFLRSQEENNVGHLNASATNENVLFCEKKDYSHLGGFTYINDCNNSIETTTEL